ncbi:MULTISPECIES: response regulator [Paraburkholderia]|uniref:response regulator n=1 Tax=Paraburkholderia TaxID=1822464 RepID=UPI0035205A35
MPGIDGLELQRRMVRTGVPIIFITGNDDPAVREKALAQGAAGCLTKPLDGAVLISAAQITLGSPNLQGDLPGNRSMPVRNLNRSSLDQDGQQEQCLA